MTLPIESRSSEHQSPPVKLPKYLPEDMLELPAIDPFSTNLCIYLSRGGRWSFQRHLEHLPEDGVGKLHSAIYLAVLAGLAEGHPSAEVHYLVQKTAERNRRPPWIAYREVVDALDGAHRWLSGSSTNAISTGGSRIDVNQQRTNWVAVEQISKRDDDLSSLEMASGDIPDTPEAILQRLYANDELICLGRSFADSMTRPLGEWLSLDLQHYQFIVPAPMTAPTGITQQGKESSRCLANTGTMRFIVVEFDFTLETNPDLDRVIEGYASVGKTLLDLNAVMHAHLQAYLPLAMVVHSGRKSLHGWYPCQGLTDAQREQFMGYARQLGADPQLFRPCQYSRMPWGTRQTGECQRVVYFNQSVLQKA